VSNRLNPSLPGFAEKEPLGGHYVAPLAYKKKKITDATLFYPLREQRYTH
jgi:hypothetical protein